MKKFKVTFIAVSGDVEAAYVRATDYSQCHYVGLYDSVGNLVVGSSVVKVELCLDVVENKIMDQTGDVAES